MPKVLSTVSSLSCWAACEANFCENAMINEGLPTVDTFSSQLYTLFNSYKCRTYEMGGFSTLTYPVVGNMINQECTCVVVGGSEVPMKCSMSNCGTGCTTGSCTCNATGSAPYPNLDCSSLIQRCTDSSCPQECPTGGCTYLGSPLIYTKTCTSFGCNADEGVGEFPYSYYGSAACNKVIWDPGHDNEVMTNCCLGVYDPSADAQLLCDPRWCPMDPVSACADVLVATCTTMNSDGVPLMSVPNHPCYTWAQVGSYGVDEAVLKFCSAHPDSPSCACVNPAQAQQACEPNCIPFTSVTSDPSNTEPGMLPNVRGIVYADGSTTPPTPINVVDSVCLNPACRDPTVLKTWSIDQLMNSCPSHMCIQVADGNQFTAKDIQTSGLYVDSSWQSCGTITQQTAQPRIGTSQLTVPLPLASDGKVVANNLPPVVVLNVANAGAGDFTFAVTSSPPEGVTVIPPAVNRVPPGDQALVQIQVDRDTFEPAPVSFTVVASDVNGTLPSVSTNLTLLPYDPSSAIAPPPQCDSLSCLQPPPGTVTVEYQTPEVWNVATLVVLVLASLVVVGFLLARRRLNKLGVHTQKKTNGGSHSLEPLGRFGRGGGGPQDFERRP